MVFFSEAKPEEYELLCRIGYQEWGRTNEAFEEYVMRNEYPKKSFVVKDERGIILSALEILEAPLFGLVVGSSGLASVVTPLEYRGKGYASLLLQKVLELIVPTQEHPLFAHSEIPVAFYLRLGFAEVHPIVPSTELGSPKDGKRAQLIVYPGNWVPDSNFVAPSYF